MRRDGRWCGRGLQDGADKRAWPVAIGIFPFKFAALEIDFGAHPVSAGATFPPVGIPQGGRVGIADPRVRACISASGVGGEPNPEQRVLRARPSSDRHEKRLQQRLIFGGANDGQLEPTSLAPCLGVAPAQRAWVWVGQLPGSDVLCCSPRGARWRRRRQWQRRRLGWPRR